MKLLSLKIEKADTCGGLLDGLTILFRNEQANTELFDPLCLIGPNGSGKSQLLQVIAEIFQAAFHKYLPSEERGTPNDGLKFEIEYLVNVHNDTKNPHRVRIFRRSKGKTKQDISIEVFKEDNWEPVYDPAIIGMLLPAKVIGYTSGGNETLSLPFFSSRAGYADKVGTNALDEKKKSEKIADPRLLLIDYSTNLEVLVANLLLNSKKINSKLLQEPNLKSLRSFRCVVQLNHAEAPDGGVKLTFELEEYVEFLKRCSTCFSYDEQHKSWIFDFYVNNATHEAFQHYWKKGALELYSCFHKLAMLNDLIIPKKARDLFKDGVRNRRFASRLPEPFDQYKVFRFERVEFISNKSGKPVDYVSLSDGEHQLAQLLGTACMVSMPNVLFLLDEPESHFNPLWRVEFIKKLLQLPTGTGERSKRSSAAQQECLITTHSPFVPSDMQRENVLIFKKESNKSTIDVRRPLIQTYGSRFDAILAECFDIAPPISALSRDRVEQLLKNGNAEEIDTAISELGESTARMRLAARLNELEEEQ